MFARCNGLEEISLRKVRVGARHCAGTVGVEVLDSLVALEVVFDPVVFAVGIDPLECVAGVAIHEAVAIGRSSVREEDAHLVATLRREREEVPEHVRVRHVGLWVPFLRVDEVRELARVTDEEDRRVVSDHIVVAVFRVELDGEAARVARGICAALLSAHRGETQKERRALAGGGKELGLRELGDLRVGHLEIAMCTGALGMHDTLGNAFTVEVRQFVDQVEVLEQQRAIRAGAQAVLVIVHWSTI